jgi:hypothetical protein
MHNAAPEQTDKGKELKSQVGGRVFWFFAVYVFTGAILSWVYLGPAILSLLLTVLLIWPAYRLFRAYRNNELRPALAVVGRAALVFFVIIAILLSYQLYVELSER